MAAENLPPVPGATRCKFDQRDPPPGAEAQGVRQGGYVPAPSDHDAHYSTAKNGNTKLVQAEALDLSYKIPTERVDPISCDGYLVKLLIQDSHESRTTTSGSHDG